MHNSDQHRWNAQTAKSQTPDRSLAGEAAQARRRGADGARLRNEAAAFEIVMERHVDAAFSLAYRMIGRRALAEDVVQEALLSLWRTGARYDRSRGACATGYSGSPTTARSTRCVAMACAPARTSAMRVSANAWRHRSAPTPRRSVATRRGRSAGARELPAEQTRVIELAYFGGFTHTEIAAMLDLPIGTVKGRMRLGLEKMRGGWTRWRC